MQRAAIKKYISMRISSTLLRWILSYCMVLALPVIFGGIIYGDALAREQKNVHQIQYQALYSTQTYFENELENLYQICYSLLNSKAVAALNRNAGEGYTPEQMLRALEVKEQIASDTVINSAISDLYLYFPKQDTVIANDLFSPLKDVNGFEQKRFGCSLEEFRNDLVSTAFRGEIRLAGGRLVYLYATDNGQEQAPRVVLYLDERYIRQMTEREGLKVSFLFSEEEWFGVEEPSFLEAVRLVRQAEAEGKKQLKARGKALQAQAMDSYWLMRDSENFLLLQDSEQYAMSYLIQVSRQEYQKTVNSMIGLLICYIGACILLGGLLIYYLAKVQYLPLKELLQFVTSGRKKELSGNDEFVQIRASVEELREEYQQSRSELADNQASVRNAYMNVMLKGYRRPELWENRLLEWIGHFQYGSFVLLGIEIGELGKIWEGEEPVTSQEYDLAVFAIESVLHELLETVYPSVEAETEGMIFSIVNVAEELEETELDQVLLKLIVELKEFFLNYYEMELAVSISRVHYGLEALPLCYRDICDLLEYRNWNPREQNSTLCCAQIALNQEEGWRKQCADMLRSLEKHQIKEAVAQFSEIIAGMSAELPQKESDNREITEQQVEEIAVYIQAHYMEPQLTVGAIAEQYGQNISTLSKQFKRWKKYGLLEYINLQRFERAKELLAADYSVKEAAELVGFYDAQPLNRLFRKSLGMTPGEYKRMARE